MSKLTRGQTIAADVTALLRARNPLLWVVSKEEKRVEALLFEAAAAAGYQTRFWDAAQGVTDLSGKTILDSRGEPIVECTACLNEIRETAQRETRGFNAEAIAKTRNVWIMRDLPVWLNGPIGILALRNLRNLARQLPGISGPRQAVIVLSPSKEVPPELANHCIVIDWPLPDREEIGALLDAAMSNVESAIKEGKIEALNGKRESAIDAAVGLSGEEAESCFSKSLVQMRRIDPVAIAQEKKRIIAKSGALEWLDPLAGGLDAVGGLEYLKAWLMQRRLAFSLEARAYGLPLPKGVLLVGVPGGGKTYTAKALSAAWGGIPLIKWDLNAAKGKFVGQSESNIRENISVINAIGPCIVLIDEIEKALAGATQGAADGGVSSDALGTVLSWMQDRTSSAFVIATANNVESLPPELLRKGRFDELFFVDLPNAAERVGILEAALKTNKRNYAAIDLDAVARKCETFTGSEIAAIVPESMFAAFADKARDITTDDLLTAADSVVPLARTAATKITALRQWAKERCRSASKSDSTNETAREVRVLDIA